MLQNQHLQLAEAGLEKKGYLGTAPQIIPSKLLGVVFLWGFVFVSQPSVTCYTDCSLFPTLTFLLLLSVKSIVEERKKQRIWFICKQPNVLFFFLTVSRVMWVEQEAWCKRLPPNSSFKRQPSLNVMSKGGQLRQQDSALTRTKKLLLEAADEIGRLIQYNCPGFLQNKRQV
jgi:hypothetical protein